MTDAIRPVHLIRVHAAEKQKESSGIVPTSINRPPLRGLNRGFPSGQDGQTCSAGGLPDGPFVTPKPRQERRSLAADSFGLPVWGSWSARNKPVFPGQLRLFHLTVEIFSSRFIGPVASLALRL